MQFHQGFLFWKILQVSKIKLIYNNFQQQFIGMASKYLQKFPVPAGFQQILSDFTKEVLRDQPSNIIQYAAQYFQMLEKGKKLEFNSKHNVRRQDKKHQLAYNPKNAQDITKKASIISQKISSRAVQNQSHKVAPPIQKPRVQHKQQSIASVHVQQQTHVQQQQTHVAYVAEQSNHQIQVGTEKTVTGQQTGNYVSNLSQEVAQNQEKQQNEEEEEEPNISPISPEDLQMNEAIKIAISQAVDLVFQKYDANKSGFLQSKQIRNFVKQVILQMNEGITPSQEQIQEFVRQVDNDHDGKISRAELQNFVQGLMGV